MPTAIEEAEFRGLFFGEGCIHLRCYKRRAKRTDTVWLSYAVALSISQRMDNVGMLLWLRDTFGGRVHGAKSWNGKHAPSASWYTTKTETVVYLLNVLLQGHVASVKRAQAKAALEFILLIRPRGTVRIGQPYTEQEQQERTARYLAFRAMKRYPEDTPQHWGLYA